MAKKPLPEFVLKAIRQRHGMDENDKSNDASFNKMTLERALDEYLKWEGISGWTYNILKLVNCYVDLPNFP